MKDLPIYETTSTITEGQPSFNYLFTSEGKDSVDKMIQYSPIQYMNGRHIYNLGFGNYDAENNSIIDTVNTNNDDIYVVFNTVLHTVPDFFGHRPEDVIYVTGSDNEDNLQFIESCKQSCVKNCSTKCRNVNRRIRTYSYFVNKNFDNLSEDYVFFGQAWDNDSFTDYCVGENYKAIMVYKKKKYIFAP